MSYAINGLAMAIQAGGRPPDFPTLLYVMPHLVELRKNGRPVFTIAIDRMESRFTDGAVIYMAILETPINTEFGDVVEAYLRAPAGTPPGQTLETPAAITAAGLRMASSIFISPAGEKLAEGPELDSFIVALERLL